MRRSVLYATDLLTSHNSVTILFLVLDLWAETGQTDRQTIRILGRPRGRENHTTEHS